MGAFSTEMLTYSPLAYWRLGESSGGMVDAAGNLADGTYHNTPMLGETGAVDDADTAVKFNGTNEYASAPGASQLSGATAFTVNFFAKETATPSGDRTIWHWAPGGGHYVYVGQRASGVLRLFIYKSLAGPPFFENQFVDTDSAVDLSSFKMITVTYNAGTVEMYVNGASVASTSGGDTITALPTGSPTYYLASFSGANTFFDGTLDEVAVVGSELTSSNVSGLYASALPNKAIADIWLDTRPTKDLYATINLHLTETVDLTAGIQLDTRLIDLTAGIDLATQETISPDLSAGILLQTFDQAVVDGTTGYWTLKVAIDGTDVSDKLTRTADVEYEEDASGLATVHIYPDPGVFLLTDYVGKKIQITHQELDVNGALRQEILIFNGWISDPYFDPDPGVIMLECTTDLQGALDARSREEIENLTQGSWSPSVFEEGAQGYAYAMDRMRTRPAAMWHSPGGIIITDWAAKGSADIEFTDDEVIHESISYENASRRDLLNKLSITFDYRFERMRQRTISVIFEMSQTFCDVLINGFKFCQRSMVERASEGGGWVVQGDITYEPLPPAGIYKCFPFAFGPAAVKYIAWGIQYGGTVLEDYDNQYLCWGARWLAAKRWAQTVTERYEIIINAPQSQAGNGDIVYRESYSLRSEQDIDDWLSEEQFQGTGSLSGFTGVGGHVPAGSYTLGDVARDATDDLLTGRAAAEEARQVAIDAGVADVLQAHRQTSVSFSSTFQPGVDLTKTVRLNTSHVVAKGKVRRVRHLFGIEDGQAQTDITLAISRHFGTGLVSSSPQTPEDEPDKPVESGIPTHKRLGSRVGGLTTTEALDPTWDGYFTNYIYDYTDDQPFAAEPSNPAATVYPERFICEYPEISGSALDALELPADQELDVDIPLDELTLTQ